MQRNSVEDCSVLCVDDVGVPLNEIRMDGYIITNTKGSLWCWIENQFLRRSGAPEERRCFGRKRLVSAFAF